MDSEDRLMLRFLLKWAPYGGPPAEETFCTFGLTVKAVYERCAEIVSRERAAPRCLPPADIDLLVGVRNRVLQNNAPSAHHEQSLRTA